MSTFFPFYEKIDGKTFLLVGGGRVAAEKLSRLLAFTEAIVVVAKVAAAVHAVLKAQGANGVKVLEREFLPEDLMRCDYAVLATGDRELEREIVSLCRERGIPVNVADAESLCTFAFPAIVKRGSLVATAFTSGKSPLYAARLKQEIEELLPDQIEEILDALGAVRTWLPERLKAQESRKRCYGQLLEQSLGAGRALQQEEIEEIVRAWEETA